MLKRILRFLGVVLCCVTISVFSLHLFVLATAPEAVQDAQYAISFMISGAFGWLSGALCFFIFNQLEKRMPRITPYLYVVFGTYAALLVIACIGYESWRFGGAFSGGSFYLFLRLPMILAMSPMGASLVFLPGRFLWVELAAFSPLILFLGVLFKRRH